jgi:transposase-like protein
VITSSRTQNEEETVKLLSVQFSIIHNSIRSLIYFRELQKHVTDQDKFWVVTKNAHLQSFVTSWTKCFGGPREGTHWKKSILVNSEFKRKLRLHVGLNARGFEKYTKAMLGFRNQVLSHTDVSLVSLHIPSMDAALEALLFLHDALRGELASLNKLPVPTLYKGPLCVPTWFSNLQAESSALISAAYSSTHGMDEYQ